jgi:hypothetical protein
MGEGTFILLKGAGFWPGNAKQPETDLAGLPKILSISFRPSGRVGLAAGLTVPYR